MWLADVSSNDVIPRGYDLSLPHETQAFIDDFRCQRAEAWLKTLYKRLTGLDTPDPDTLVVRAIEGQSCSNHQGGVKGQKSDNNKGDKGDKASTLEVEEWTTVDTPRLTATTSTPSAMDHTSTSKSSGSSSDTIEVIMAVFETFSSSIILQHTL